jgi:capsular exopolysaccharide synthesis family protein
MRANIFLVRPDRPFKTLLLTSPAGSEGKSFILANLAIVLASAGNRVIVVDADMRSPSLHELFDRPNVTGLADVLSDHEVGSEDSWSVPLQGTDFDNLYLLSAGLPPADPVALLTSHCFPALLECLSGQGDVILIDSPPLLGPPDATVLATLAEGTILVVSAGLTRHELIQRARDRLLGQQGVNLLGFVVNRIKPSSRYYDYSPATESRKPKWKGDGAWLTLGEAAARLGISEDQARRWCESGRLPATRKGLWWQIDRNAFEEIVRGAREVETKAEGMTGCSPCDSVGGG